VHDLVDKHYDDPTIPTTSIIKCMQEYCHNGEELWAFALKQASALADTQAYAAKYGNTYSKPTWSNHYKKNYPDLLKEAEKLDSSRTNNGLDTFTPTEWAAQILVSLKGFRKLKNTLDKEGYTCHSREGLLKWERNDIAFAGRYDALLKDKDGNLVLVDWKTSSGKTPWTSEKISYYNQLYVYADVLTTQGTPISAIAIGDLAQGTLVFGDMSNMSLALRRFHRNAHAVETANSTGMYPIAAGQGEYTCQSCPVRTLKGGCKYANN
jgi:hypothetical protein